MLRKLELLLAASLLILTALAVPALAAAPAAADRLVCLGDSITDGYTYGQILIQALREAGKPVPTIICSGRSSDTAPQMAARLDQTVLVFRPQWVTFGAGTNDAVRGVTNEQFEKALREIVAKVQAHGGRLVLLTPSLILSRNGKTPQEQETRRKQYAARLDCFEAIIRKVAAEKHCLLAENHASLLAAIRSGKTIMTEDGVHPNYLGQAIMARVILDALGCGDVALPRTFEPRLFPCVVRQWKMRLAPLDEKGHPLRLTAQTAAELVPDATWQTYALPDPPPDPPVSAGEWTEQLRRNGFALRMEQQIGKGPIQAVAQIDAPAEKQVYLQIGIGASTVWFNGVKVHDQGDAWTGFHAGKERIAVKLRAGANRLVVETGGPHFFLGVSDDMVWEGEIR